MGFRLESARATVLSGQPAVELRLTDGTHHALVTEQRIVLQGSAGQGIAGQGGAGQGRAEREGAGQDIPSQDSSPLRLWKSSAWSATYRTPGHTFLYETDLPAEQADDALPILQRLGDQAGAGVEAGVRAASREAAGDPISTRLQRGVNRIVAFLTP